MLPGHGAARVAAIEGVRPSFQASLHLRGKGLASLLTGVTRSGCDSFVGGTGEANVQHLSC